VSYEGYRGLNIHQLIRLLIAMRNWNDSDSTFDCQVCNIVFPLDPNEDLRINIGMNLQRTDETLGARQTR
jgi:hypothetical protein